MSAVGKGLKNAGVVSIREMVPADLPATMVILRESPEAAMWSEGSLLERYPTADALVAVAEEGVAGILISRTAAAELEILNLAVGRGQRRKGVASHLGNVRLEKAFADGVLKVYLEVRASNAPAFAFYESLGFQICGRRTGYYRDPAEDAVLMVLHRVD